MNTPKIRGPREEIQGVVYIARLLDKMRLSHKGELPEEYEAMRGRTDGRGFDAVFSSMLGFDYKALDEQVRHGADDDSAVNWIWRVRGLPTEIDKKLWNAYMSKFGWRDEYAPVLENSKKRDGVSNRHDICTFFDLLDADEGRL